MVMHRQLLQTQVMSRQLQFVDFNIQSQ